MKKKTLLIFLLSAVSALSLTGAVACSDNNNDESGSSSVVTHTYGSWTVTNENLPTQENTGKATRSCTDNDGSVQELTLPALTDSNYVITDDTATTESGGTGTYTITINGALISFTAATPVKQAAHVHVYTEIVVNTKPTQTTKGKVYIYCNDNDGGYEVKELPVLTDSRYTITENTATADVAGTAKYTITVDGTDITFKTTSPAGSTNQTGSTDQVGGDSTGGSTGGSSDGEQAHTHTYGAWTVSELEKPTQTATGTARRSCTGNDGVGEELTLPVLSDTRYSITNNTATTSSAGTGNYTITLNGNLITFKAATAQKSEAQATATYTVTYISDNETVLQKNVAAGTKEVAPTVTKDGYFLVGWTQSSSGEGSIFDFNTSSISSNITLYAKWSQINSKITYSQANYESAAFEWDDTNAKGAEVYYKLTGTNTYTKVESALIRQVDSDTARVDIVGLKGNNSYDFKIVNSSQTDDPFLIEAMAISAYDRSGYAHFNYTDGVGAYNDDGSIKDNTLVIYVTDENKNDITDSCYVNGEKVNISQYLWKGYKGIGYILNNRQYESNTARANYGIQKLCFTYGAVAIRIVGKVNAEDPDDATVSLIEGLTAYNSTDNGGSLKDNGRMARMCNAKNVTVEGIGNDAEIYGWGIHFVSNDNLNAYSGAGKSFEVRNITFSNYPEDAIGFEGTQGTKVDQTTGSITGGASSADSNLVSSVERCWVHHNSFNPGYCATPAESDKGEGDGSCDFKRGQYFTLSYNYFTDCHKTNLVGSSDDSLTYNVSMHHNWWNNCGSRQPLVRRANLHFYNNYISGDISTGASLNYITSARANSYVFSEANYYDGCKQAILLASGGAVKTYNNVYYACFGTNSGTAVENRTDKVSNSCKFIYRNIDYSSFDTNSTQFYYDSENKRSDCYLTDAVTARADAIMYAGVLKRDYDSINLSMNKTTPTKGISVNSNETLTVDLTKVAKGSSEVSGVYFTGITGVASGVVKGKGQVATFTLTDDSTDVSITVNGTAEVNLGELVDSNGKVWAGKFTSVNVTLPAGTYFIASGSKDKEVSISSLKFTSGVTAEQKVEKTIALIEDIGTVTLTDDIKLRINAAKLSYESLPDANKASVTNREKLFDAIDEYSSLLAQQVEQLINAIGEVNVNSNSGSKITAARNAYNDLSASEQALVGNYNTLVAAETAYAGIAVQALNNVIANLAATSSVRASDKAAITALLDSYEDAYSQYEALSDEAAEDGSASQKSQITNIKKVIDGIAALNEMIKPFDFKDALAALDSTPANNKLTDIAAVKTLYEALTSDQKALVADVKDKYDSLIAYYTEEMAKVQVVLFYNGATYNGVSVTGTYDSKATYTYEGTTYKSPLKIESKTKVTFTTVEGQTVKLYVGASGLKIYLDSTVGTSDSDGFVTFTNVSAGSHTVTKKDGGILYYMIIS
jgi:uncharacterized repeat protein (TIGR02543 family)